MKKFQFRLEPLLKMKAEIEKKKQRELAEVQRRIIAQEEKLWQNEKENQLMQSRQKEHLSGKFTINDMLIYAKYYMNLKRKKISDKEMLRILEIDSEKKRKALLGASIERKRFDRLKDILKLKYLAELNKRESKEADESGRISHQNKSSH